MEKIITKICNVRIENSDVYYEVKWGRTWERYENIPPQSKALVDSFWQEMGRYSDICSPKKRKAGDYFKPSLQLTDDIPVPTIADPSTKHSRFGSSDDKNNLFSSSSPVKARGSGRGQSKQTKQKQTCRAPIKKYEGDADAENKDVLSQSISPVKSNFPRGRGRGKSPGRGRGRGRGSSKSSLTNYSSDDAFLHNVSTLQEEKQNMSIILMPESPKLAHRSMTFHNTNSPVGKKHLIASSPVTGRRTRGRGRGSRSLRNRGRGQSSNLDTMMSNYTRSGDEFINNSNEVLSTLDNTTGKRSQCHPVAYS